jgi:hypothetical protein
MKESAASKSPVYRLRICPIGPVRDADDIRRLKQLLKSLLRAHHYRCVSVEQEPQQQRKTAIPTNRKRPR